MSSTRRQSRWGGLVSNRARVWLAPLALIATLVSGALAQPALAQPALAQSATPAAKPRVPPGRDPGGVAVAFIGDGVDYTRPEIASRLARDGEGEIIGWDFVDGDRRPFERCHSNDCLDRFELAFSAPRIVAKAPNARLVVVRSMADRPQTFVDAFKFIGESPARIVLVAPGGAEFRELLLEAARRLPKLLIIVPARRMSGGSQGRTQSMTNAPPANLLVVGATAQDQDMQSRDKVDVLVSVRTGSDFGGGPIHGGPDVAAASAAAIAARALALEPRLDAAALKLRIISLAPHGIIADPDRHFQPK